VPPLCGGMEVIMIKSLSDVSIGFLYIQFILKNHVRATISGELTKWRLGVAYSNDPDGWGDGHSLTISFLCFEIQYYFKNDKSFGEINEEK
jgi:hypothetical protein